MLFNFILIYNFIFKKNCLLMSGGQREWTDVRRLDNIAVVHKLLQKQASSSKAACSQRNTKEIKTLEILNKERIFFQ